MNLIEELNNILESIYLPETGLQHDYNLGKISGITWIKEDIKRVLEKHKHSIVLDFKKADRIIKFNHNFVIYSPSGSIDKIYGSCVLSGQWYSQLPNSLPPWVEEELRVEDTVVIRGSPLPRFYVLKAISSGDAWIRCEEKSEFYTVPLNDLKKVKE